MAKEPNLLSYGGGTGCKVTQKGWLPSLRWYSGFGCAQGESWVGHGGYQSCHLVHKHQQIKHTTDHQQGRMKAKMKGPRFLCCS